MKLIIPPHTIEWYPAGVDCTNSVDGDLFLIDHGTWNDDIIKFGQEALTFTEPELKGYTWCAHSAIRRGTVDGVAALSEMGWRGYERREVHKYRHHLYAKVHFEVSDELRAHAVMNDEACDELTYGWVEYPPIIVDGLTGATLACTWGDSLICSAHCTMVLMGLGLFPDRPPSMIVPARMAFWVGASIIHSGTPTTIIVTPGIPREN